MFQDDTTTFNPSGLLVPAAEWPPDLAGFGPTSSIRGEYIAAMKSADAGDLKLLIELQVRYAVACDNRVRPGN